MVLLRAELGYAEDGRLSVLLAFFIKRNGANNFVNRNGREDY